MPLENGSFEDSGTLPGEAAFWGAAVVETSDDWAAFDASALPYEAFLEGWKDASWTDTDGVESAVRAFLKTYTEAAKFDGGPAYERFSGNWNAPLLKGKATTTTSATKGAVVVGRTSGARAFLGPGTSGTTIYTYWVNDGLAGQSKTFSSGEVLDVVAPATVSMGTGDGSKRLFTASASSTPITKKSIQIHVWKSDGTLAVVTDDGAGKLTSTDTTLLDSSASNVVDYTTGAISVTFASPPKKSLHVVLYYEGSTGTLTLSGAWSQVTESPWVEESISDFSGSPSPVAAASFDSTTPEDHEDFEEEWNDERNVGDNKDSQSSFGSSDVAAASFDSSTPESHEDFEEEWLSNENSQSSFGPSDTATAVFGTPGDSYEAFNNTDWSTSFVI